MYVIQNRITHCVAGYEMNSHQALTVTEPVCVVQNIQIFTNLTVNITQMFEHVVDYRCI